MYSRYLDVRRSLAAKGEISGTASVPHANMKLGADEDSVETSWNHEKGDREKHEGPDLEKWRSMFARLPYLDQPAAVAFLSPCPDGTDFVDWLPPDLQAQIGLEWSRSVRDIVSQNRQRIGQEELKLTGRFEKDWAAIGPEIERLPRDQQARLAIDYYGAIIDVLQKFSQSNRQTTTFSKN
jgi:hypothetical protein